MRDPRCREDLYAEGKPSPRTCHVCGLGPCRNDMPSKPKSDAPRFPTMLRKMWSGGEVQAWIDENWPKAATPTQVEPAGWVRPSERMPNEGQFVFAAVHEWDQASAPLTVAHGQYKGGEWLACGEDQGTLYAPVLWMPAPPGIRLPAPPKDHP